MQCRICGVYPGIADDVRKLHTIPNYPKSAGPVRKKGLPEVGTCDVTIGFCFTCGTCTLIEPNPEEIIYDDEYTSSNISVGFGGKIDEKAERFINFIGNTTYKMNPNRLLEIGCYDGSLMKELITRYGFDTWGCEPCHTAEIAIENDLRVKKDYFSADLYEENFFNVIVFRNVLEHVPYPTKFLVEVGKVLRDDGLIVIEVPDGEYRIKNGMIGTIVPQHPSYFGKESLRNLLAVTGFKDIYIEKRSGTLYAVAQKGFSLPIPRDIITVYDNLKCGTEKNAEVYKKIFLSTWDLSDIYIYGANTGTLELLATKAINKKNVIYAIDDDPLKWNKEIVNSGIPVKDREFIKKIGGKKIVIICSYYSHDELFNLLDKNLKKPFEIIRISPKVESVVRK